MPVLAVCWATGRVRVRCAERLLVGGGLRGLDVCHTCHIASAGSIAGSDSGADSELGY